MTNTLSCRTLFNLCNFNWPYLHLKKKIKCKASQLSSKQVISQWTTQNEPLVHKYFLSASSKVMLSHSLAFGQKAGSYIGIVFLHRSNSQQKIENSENSISEMPILNSLAKQHWTLWVIGEVKYYKDRKTFRKDSVGSVKVQEK